jgi:soluble lytic murein transglycosylase-like protein
MRHARLAGLAAALTTLALAVPTEASAATAESQAATPKLRAGCDRAYTATDHRAYARRVFKRARITRHATSRLTTLRRCQAQGRSAIRSARRAERRLARWRSLYHCTQGKVVNCIRAATRRYGGDLAHNVACARSESRLDPYAHNGGSGAAGLYQFMPSTWARTLARMGVRHKSIYSAEWQARAAAWKFRRDGFGEWSGAGC